MKKTERRSFDRQQHADWSKGRAPQKKQFESELKQSARKKNEDVIFCIFIGFFYIKSCFSDYLVANHDVLIENRSCRSLLRNIWSLCHLNSSAPKRTRRPATKPAKQANRPARPLQLRVVFEPSSVAVEISYCLVARFSAINLSFQTLTNFSRTSFDIDRLRVEQKVDCS